MKALTLEAAMTPTSILASLQLSADNAGSHRARAQRFRDEDAESYWSGRVDAFADVRKVLSLYWALNGELGDAGQACNPK